MKKHDYRRRTELRTNYEKRFGMLKSKIPRIVVRLTNKRVIMQYVLHNLKGDNVKLNVYSDVLSGIGLKTASYKSRFSGYLAGYYFGKKVVALKLKKEAILDLGMQKIHKGGKLFSVLKGMVDSGMAIAHEPEVLPDMKTLLAGKSETELKEYLKKIDGLKF
ncbi:MAG: 50S ribosomal protein L18 [Candidatus ainarchaeum sp.]|nr:50S ribosomal protein L18 [Candidatus ainarchaeum sp.]